MSLEFYNRVAKARVEFLQQDMEPDSLYLGNEEYKQMIDILWPIISFDVYMGMKVFRVDCDSHFAVAKTSVKRPTICL